MRIPKPPLKKVELSVSCVAFYPSPALRAPSPWGDSISLFPFSLFSPKTRDMDVSETNFRKIMGLFPTGVTVVTVCHDDVDMGLTISSFTSLSLDPPQILFCLSKKSKMTPFLEKTSFFAVNILREDQSHVSHGFAQHTPMDWNLLPTHRHGHTGCLLMKEALGHVICQKETLYEGGDHTIIIGKVIDLEGPQNGNPLVRCRGHYLTTHPPL